MRRRPQFHGYKPPGKDTPRAKANATLLVTNARSLADITADGLARQFNLKPATAERLLEAARARRVGT